MKKLYFIIACALSTIAIGLSTWSIVRSYGTTEQIEYTMYIGTNDKDTIQLEMNLDEARNIIHNTMMNYFSDGFTMYDANGVWKDEHNNITLETTFVCIVENGKKSEVYAAADTLIEELNQSAILIVANTIQNADFYTGSN